MDCDFDLNAGSHYYWRVRGVDMPAGVNSLYSATADFYYMPAAVTMTGPAPGDTSAPVLTWDPLAGYTTYKVVIIRTSNGATAVTATTYGTSYSPTSALAAGSYAWYVYGIDSYSENGLLPATNGYRYFTIVAPTGTASPNPISATLGGPGSAVVPGHRAVSACHRCSGSRSPEPPDMTSTPPRPPVGARSG